MKDNKNNAAKKKRFVDVDAIEKVIAELPLLARQGKIGIQRALKCGFPAAAKIYDLIKDKSRIKIEKNIFELDAKRQMLYLEQLINDTLPDSGYTPDEVYERLYAEMTVIEELGLAAVFLFAQSVAEILRELSDIPFARIERHPVFCRDRVLLACGVHNRYYGNGTQPYRTRTDFRTRFRRGQKARNAVFVLRARRNIACIYGTHEQDLRRGAFMQTRRRIGFVGRGYERYRFGFD